MFFQKIKKTILYFFLIAFALSTIYPFVWMVFSSFKNNQQIMENPYWIPKVLNVQNYYRAWTKAGMGSAMLNSGVVSAVTILISLFICSLASYVLARHTFRLSFVVYAFFILGLTIPAQATLVPLFLMIQRLHLMNNYFSLILPYAATCIPFGILMLTGYMKSIPKELDEIALIEGCSELRICFQIILPLTRPALLTVVIITMRFAWNEFLIALVLAAKPAIRTVPVALGLLTGEHIQEYGVQLAAATLSITVILVVYIFFQKQITSGLTSGALK